MVFSQKTLYNFQPFMLTKISFFVIQFGLCDDGVESSNPHYTILQNFPGLWRIRDVCLGLWDFYWGLQLHTQDVCLSESSSTQFSMGLGLHSVFSSSS